MATANSSGEAPGTTQFRFEERIDASVPQDAKARFSDDVVHDCIIGNRGTIPIH